MSGGWDRRAFVKAAAGLGGAWLATGCGAGGEPAEGGGPSAPPIGLQLYTVRNLLQEDFDGTLEQVASIGYTRVEPHDLFGRSPRQVRDTFDRLGLSSPSAHIPLERIRGEPEAVLAEAETLGHRWVVVPWIEESERNEQGYRRLAADLNRLGEAARERGMRAAHHNHDFEFAPLPGGGTGMDLLLAETDPALVDIELDLHWTTRAGQDPVALFQEHPGRFPLWHVKDLAREGGEPRIVDVGKGEIDFARLFRGSEAAGLRHFFVEHDDPADAIATIRDSYRHLRELRAE